MTKKEFYKEIKESLVKDKFSKDEINSVIEYYDEIINDKIEFGFEEEDAIISLGDVKTITNSIKANVVYERSDNKKINPSSSSIRDFWIILGICSSPILIPLGIGFFAMFMGILIALIAMIVSFAGAAIITFVGLIYWFIETMGTEATLSTILIIVGIYLIIIALFSMLTVLLVSFSKTILNAVVRLFSKSVREKSKKENLKYV